LSIVGARLRRLTLARRAELRALATRSAQVVVSAAVVGAVTGLGVALIDRIIVDVGLDTVRRWPLWLMALAPCIGLAGAGLALRIVGHGTSPATADEYLHAFHDPHERLGWRALAARLTASISTLGLGGAMGLEGPSLYLGATLGAQTQRRLPRLFGGADSRVLMTTGAAAGVAAIFKAPATGAIFALEVPYQDDLARNMLLPALVGSATSYLAFVAVNGTTPLFPIIGNPSFDFRDLAGAALLGVAAGTAARLFAFLLRRAKGLTTRGHPVVRVGAAGVTLASIFVVGRLLTGESLTIGPGYDAIAWALDPAHATWLVLAMLGLRCAATVATVAGGGAGGLFIPLVVAGALTGRAMGGAVHALDTSLFVVVGVAAFLGAGYRVPLAGVMFVAETTGRPGFVVPGLLAAVAAELVMGRSSVTSYQKAASRNAGISTAVADLSVQEVLARNSDPAVQDQGRAPDLGE
jgi:chloride channel protein, CIC family